MIIESFRIMFMANGGNEHVTMFTLYLPLADFSSLMRLSSFELASLCITVTLISS